MTTRVDTIIAVFQQEEAKAGTFRDLFQRTADLVYPRRDQITMMSAPGENKTNRLVDSTAVMASMEMASGLSQNLIPPGQPFFALEASRRQLNDIESVKNFFSDAADIIHEHLFGSNFLTELNSVLRALSVFGTGNIFSEFTTELNFREYDIGSYLISENSKGRVDTMRMKVVFTARQAIEEWGNKAGAKVLIAAADEKTANDVFEFIHVVQPREQRFSMRGGNLNMPFESVIIGLKDKNLIEESGFEEFPYHVPRWTKASNEVWGRGQGTFALPDISMLQRMRLDLIDSANKHVNPPVEVLEGFEDDVDLSAGAINHVAELGSIKAVDRNALGNFPIGLDFVEAQQELIRKAFFNDIFVQLSNLKGDRRTTFEIEQRLLEGLQRLGPPIGRINNELFTPLIRRVFLLLIRNGQMPPIPPELSEANFKVEYIGRLALQLKSHQVQGFQRTVEVGASLEPIQPGTLDNLNIDKGFRDLARNFGVRADNIATPEEVQAKREARQQAQQAAQALELAQAVGQGFKDTSKAAEAGSPAQKIEEAIGA